MYKAMHISPMIPSYDTMGTTSFFVDVLGFNIYMGGSTAGEYTILSKDDFSVHILNAGTGIGEMEFYLSVDDVDSLWQDIKDKLTGIKVRAPFNREYGMREVHIIIPHTKTLIFIGSRIANT